MVSRARMAARLVAADWLASEDLQAILDLLDGRAGRTRAVGGIVRDTVLGLVRAETDLDLATELVPAEVMARARAAGLAAYPTGFAHGTVTLVRGEVTTQVTSLREDIETDGRHAVVRFGSDWAADAARRDFTINALYADMNGTLYDPLDGARDLAAPRIRFIGDPNQRIAEDLLRVYRFFRFSASHARETFDPAGLEAARRAAPLLGRLAPERVGTEMRRMLGVPKIAQTLKLMSESGILELDGPTLEALRNYGTHAGRPSLVGRLAVLLAHIEAARLGPMWRLSNGELAAATATLSAARLLTDLRLAEASYHYPDVLDDGLAVAAALAGWTEAGKGAVRERLGGLPPADFPIGGADLLARGMAPGPRVGAELKRLEDAWIESGFQLDRATLLAKIAR